MVLGRERILIPELIRSLPTLAVYDVARSHSLGGLDWDFPLTEDETRKQFSYFSGTSGDRLRTIVYNVENVLFFSYITFMASFILVFNTGSEPLCLSIFNV